MSSSEGSTVDLQPLKERRESLDFELELPADDPEACFTQGERITAGTNYKLTTINYQLLCFYEPVSTEVSYCSNCLPSIMPCLLLL